MSLLRELANRDQGQSVQHLARTWFDADPTSAPRESDHPPLLEWLWANDADSRIFGTQNRLRPRFHVAERDGWVLVIEENQNVWAAGYRYDGSDNPPAVVDGEETTPKMRLNELLLRASIIEAVFSARTLVHSHELPAARVKAALRDHQLFEEVRDIDAAINHLPAVWCVEEVLVLGFRHREICSLFAGTRDGQVSEPRLLELGDWQF